jgi:DNA-binding MarR family transcriptional regulator
MPEHAITIELSVAQIRRVVRDARKDDGLLGLLGGVEGLHIQPSGEQLENPRLSRSLLQALMILSAFPADGAGRAVTDVARELGMWQGTTHRYVSTLVAVGLLERDPVSREYRLAGRG